MLDDHSLTRERRDSVVKLCAPTSLAASIERALLRFSIDPTRSIGPFAVDGLNVNDRERHSPRLFDKADQPRDHRLSRAHVLTPLCHAAPRAHKIVLNVHD